MWLRVIPFETRTLGVSTIQNQFTCVLLKLFSETNTYGSSCLPSLPSTRGNELLQAFKWSLLTRLCSSTPINIQFC